MLKTYLIALSMVVSGWIFADVPPSVAALQAELETNDVPFADLKVLPKYKLTAEEVRTYLPDEDEPQDPGKKLREHSQQFLENLYGRLSPGPIPDGAYHGAVLLPRKGKNNEYEVFFQIAKMMGMPLERPELENIMMKIWRGKTFDKARSTLVNQILDRRVLAFPAKLYCGVSLMDKNVESVIIDYAFGYDLSDYLDVRDKISTNKGVSIRDEIRMISPGFYLGRAYMDGVFALNFVLFKHGVSAAPEECEMKIPVAAIDLKN